MEERHEADGRSQAEEPPAAETPSEDAPDVAANFKPGIKFKLAS